jgi:hypothetical protein
MEIAVYILGGCAVLAGIFSGVFSTGGHRDLSLWSACLGAVLTIVAGFCWYQDFLWKRDGNAENPSQKQSALPTGATQSLVLPKFGLGQNSFTLSFGGVGFRFSREQLQSKEGGVVIAQKGEPVLKLALEGDKLELTAEVPTERGFGPIRIVKNQLLDLPQNWEINHNAEWSAVEVVDSDQKPRLQLISKSAIEIQLNAVLRTANFTHIGDLDGARVIATKPGEQPTFTFRVEKLFKYPAWKYPGLYAEDSEHQTPRRLLPDKKADILKILRSTTRGRVALFSAPINDPEPMRLLAQFGTVLQEAGFSAIETGTVPFEFNDVIISHGTKPDGKPVAEAIKRALELGGITCAERDPPWEGDCPTIFIGSQR